MDQLFSYKSFVHAFSGAVGGTSAITLFYPLNLARSKLMVSDDVKRKSTLELLLGIVKTDGFRALYQGWFVRGREGKKEGEEEGGRRNEGELGCF